MGLTKVINPNNDNDEWGARTTKEVIEEGLLDKK